MTTKEKNAIRDVLKKLAKDEKNKRRNRGN